MLTRQPPEVIAVVGSIPWPPRDGGTLRTARLLEQLATVAGVTVLGHRDTNYQSSAPAGMDIVEVSPPESRGFSPRYPHSGIRTCGLQARRTLRTLVTTRDPDWVWFAHTYLAALFPDLLGTHALVDAPNLEAARQRSLAADPTQRWRLRLFRHVEAAKARRWEPTVVRRAAYVFPVTQEDARVVAAWQGRPIVVPNAADPAPPYVPSPERGPVLIVTNLDYSPNCHGVDWFLREVWPLVIQRAPGADLVLTGRGTERVHGPHVRGFGFVNDLSEQYAAASLVAQPVAFGGGTQLKVVEAANHLRVMVGTTYSKRSAPGWAREHLFVTQDNPLGWANALVELIANTSERHRREVRAKSRQVQQPTWREVATPLLRALRSF